MRSAEQLTAARARDALREFRAALLRQQVIDDAEADAIDAECAAEVEDAIEECLREPRAQATTESIGAMEAYALTYAL
jgi:TPP-dependent pyruvate/acetoin dehydrogenase alpha subunit